MKVTQKSFEKRISEEAIVKEMEEKIADIGDFYTPVNCDTKEPLDFSWLDTSPTKF